MSGEYHKIVKRDALTCRACPTQWEGQLHDGRHFYFRYLCGPVLRASARG